MIVSMKLRSLLIGDQSKAVLVSMSTDIVLCIGDGYKSITDKNENEENNNNLLHYKNKKNTERVHG